MLLRPGGVTIDDLQASIGPITRSIAHAAGGELRSPGLMASHYAPTLPVRLDATSVADDEALLVELGKQAAASERPRAAVASRR